MEWIMKRLGGKLLAGKFLVSSTGDCCYAALETFLSLVSFTCFYFIFDHSLGKLKGPMRDRF